MPDRSFNAELAELGQQALERLKAAHRAREEALARCRETIRACGLAIRAVHRLEREAVSERLAEAEVALRRAQDALGQFPALAASGFLHDAEKEYAEARLTVALVGGDPLPSFEDMKVGLAAWLNGLAEAGTSSTAFVPGKPPEAKNCSWQWRMCTTCLSAWSIPMPLPEDCAALPIPCVPWWSAAVRT